VLQVAAVWMLFRRDASDGSGVPGRPRIRRSFQPSDDSV
jgi:hypothetical protein